MIPKSKFDAIKKIGSALVKGNNKDIELAKGSNKDIESLNKRLLARAFTELLTKHVVDLILDTHAQGILVNTRGSFDRHKIKAILSYNNILFDTKDKIPFIPNIIDPELWDIQCNSPNIGDSPFYSQRESIKIFSDKGIPVLYGVLENYSRKIHEKSLENTYLNEDYKVLVYHSKEEHLTPIYEVNLFTLTSFFFKEKIKTRCCH
jgi:hypothetical protein